MTWYKPLTPDFREKILTTIEANVSELNTCQSNALVNAQLCGYKALRNTIKSLPDGYPIPMEDKK